MRPSFIAVGNRWAVDGMLGPCHGLAPCKFRALHPRLHHDVDRRRRPWQDALGATPGVDGADEVLFASPCPGTSRRPTCQGQRQRPRRSSP
jgi:hypothetical protein